MHTRFEIEPEYADALRAAGLADFDTLFNASAGPPTSKHKHRETVPIEFDVNGKRQRFFLKRVFKVPAQHAWRPWLRGKPGYSQPVREWDNIKMMRDAGLPVMKRVAIGECRKLGIPVQAFILVEDVGMQWTLENWLVQGFPAPPALHNLNTRRLWYELGRLQRKLTEARIRWPDAHAKHILAELSAFTEGNETNWRFAMIDVERAFCRPPLPKAIRTENSDGNPVVLWPSEVETLLNSIVPRRDGASGSMSFALGYFDMPLLEAAPTPTEKIPFSFDRKAATLPMPDGFVHPRAESVRWRNSIKASCANRATLARLGIVNVDDAFSKTDANFLNKPGLQPYRTRLRLTVRDDGDGETTLYVKRYNQSPLREQLRRLLESDRAHSTAYREFQNARVLQEHGIPAMRVLAAGEEMSGWWERRSFVVTQAVAGESLETIASRWHACPDSRPNFKQRWELIKQLGEMQYQLRKGGFFHRDLYLSHIFLSRNSNGESVMQLIDLARMLHNPRRQERWEIKDLAALYYSAPKGLITRSDTLRFLRGAHYPHFRVSQNLRRDEPLAVQFRSQLIQLTRQVIRRVAKMARHDAKREARLGIHPKASDRPLAGSTDSKTVNTPTE